jgi:hypothetical protein
MPPVVIVAGAVAAGSASFGRFTVSGSGGLTGIHGEGTFTQSALTGSHIAGIHFEP